MEIDDLFDSPERDIRFLREYLDIPEQLAVIHQRFARATSRPSRPTVTREVQDEAYVPGAVRSLEAGPDGLEPIALGGTELEGGGVSVTRRCPSAESRHTTALCRIFLAPDHGATTAGAEPSVRG
jgi:hypothetical protein